MIDNNIIIVKNHHPLDAYYLQRDVQGGIYLWICFWLNSLFTLTFLISDVIFHNYLYTLIAVLLLIFQMIGVYAVAIPSRYSDKFILSPGPIVYIVLPKCSVTLILNIGYCKRFICDSVFTVWCLLTCKMGATSFTCSQVCFTANTATV